MQLGASANQKQCTPPIFEQEAQPLVRDVVGGGGSFEGLLRQWIANNGHLSGNPMAVMAQACPVGSIDQPLDLGLLKYSLLLLHALVKHRHGRVWPFNMVWAC